MRKFKYLLVFSVPLSVAIALTSYGWVCWLPLFIYFGLLPAMELLIDPDARNVEAKEKELNAKDPFYDILLYLTVPAQVGVLILFLFQLQEVGLSGWETAGRIISFGIMCGVVGINVGHELGHRSDKLAQRLGEIALLTSLENHFIPYHNYGHHRYVATPEDPATARRNEPVYLFWFRSHFGSYRMAWQIELDRMERKGLARFGLHNKMVVYTIAQVVLCLTILIAFGPTILLYFVLAAAFGILLLEQVNYIEHYGLLREQRPNGRYERVRHHHSWNSDHLIGRMVLFELSRHSDHHFQASKHYQVLESVEGSPQMPTGYPGMMIFALLTPLWCRYMNDRIDKFQTTSKKAEVETVSP